MVPMIDGAVPGITTMVVTVGPSAIGALVALLAALAWIGWGTARELHDERHGAAPADTAVSPRLAA